MRVTAMINFFVLQNLHRHQFMVIDLWSWPVWDPEVRLKGLFYRKFITSTIKLWCSIFVLIFQSWSYSCGRSTTCNQWTGITGSITWRRRATVETCTWSGHVTDRVWRMPQRWDQKWILYRNASDSLKGANLYLFISDPISTRNGTWIVDIEKPAPTVSLGLILGMM
jgi:hypothetical protein